MLAQATMCGPLATALPVAGGTSGWRSRGSTRGGAAAGHADAGEGDTLPIGDGGLPDVRVVFEEEQVSADLGGLAPGDVGLEGRGEGGGELVRVAVLQLFDEVGLFEPDIDGVAPDRQGQQQGEEQRQLLAEGAKADAGGEAVQVVVHSSWKRWRISRTASHWSKKASTQAGSKWAPLPSRRKAAARSSSQAAL